LVIARQVFEDPLGRAVCSKGSQFEACSSKLVGAIQNTELSAHCGVDSAAQIMEAHGLWQRRLALVDRNPASDHSSFGFVHAPLINRGADGFQMARRNPPSHLRFGK
jgi:hypothetical protein